MRPVVGLYFDYKCMRVFWYPHGHVQCIMSSQINVCSIRGFVRIRADQSMQRLMIQNSTKVEWRVDLAATIVQPIRKINHNNISCVMCAEMYTDRPAKRIQSVN